jgi:chromosome segregation ATPase
MLTEGERAELMDMRRRNAELRNQLIDLNNQLDQHLNRHGQKVARPFSPRQRQVTSAERQHRRNDATRRLNAEIIQKLQRADALDRVSEVRNLLNEKNSSLQKAREENRSLENVYANQMVKVEDLERTEEDMRSRKAEHHEEMRMIKEKMRRLKIQNSERSGQVKSNQRQLEKLEGKVKVQEAVGSSMKTLQELRDEESEKDRVIETLKYQVAVLSKTNASDKRHARSKTAQTSKELAELREEAALLRERAASHRLVDELADPYEL